MSASHRALDRALDLLDRLAAGLRQRRGGALVWLGLLGTALCLWVHASAPAVAVNDMVLDSFVPLDAGWRWVEGQLPHRDFRTPVGVLWYAAYGLAMQAWGPDARVILWVPVVAAAGVLLVSLAVTRARLPPLLRALIPVYLGFVAFSPRHLDRESVAHLASYNRVGWALCTAVLLLVLLPPRRRSRLVSGLEVLLGAGLLAILAYLKITYFALAGLGVLLAVALVPANRRMALATGVLAWALVLLPAGLSELPALYLADLRAAAASFDPEWARWNPERVPSMSKLVQAARFNALPLVGSILGLLWLSRTADEEQRRPTDRVALAALLLIAAILLTTVQSHDHYAPAALVPLLICIRAALERARAAPVQPAPSDRATALLSLAAAWVVLSMAAMDALTVLTHRVAASSRTASLPATQRTDSPMHRLRWGGSPEEESRLRYVETGEVSQESFEALVNTHSLRGVELQRVLDSGLEALEAHAASDARVLSLSFAQPFAWGTGSPPPRGGASWYDPGRSFGGEHPLDPALTLAEVDVVMEPRVMDLPVEWAMWEQLGAAIEAEFSPVHTPLWTVWRRRNPPAR